MQIKNIFTKLALFAVFLQGISSCSSTASSTAYGEKALSTYKTGQEIGKEAKSGVDSLKTLQEKSDNSGKVTPSNIPPPQDTSELPRYGSWSNRNFGKTINLKTDIQYGVNQNFAIVINLVYVKDDEVYSRLSTVTSRDWFRRDEKAIEELKKEKKILEIREVTILPEKEFYNYLIRAPAHAKAGLLYVRLVEDVNLYPTLFDPYKNMKLTFSGNSFSLEQN